MPGFLNYRLIVSRLPGSRDGEFICVPVDAPVTREGELLCPLGDVLEALTHPYFEALDPRQLNLRLNYEDASIPLAPDVFNRHLRRIGEELFKWLFPQNSTQRSLLESSCQQASALQKNLRVLLDRTFYFRDT